MSSWDGFEEVVAIADAGTFVRAAAIMGVSTSHVSRAIARLEKRLGTEIFHRTTRRVTLTDTGRSIVDQSRRLIQERDELLSQVHGSGDPQGDLRMTCSIALGERFIAPIVRHFTISHPRLTVSLDLTNRIVDIVGEGYDLAVRTGQVSDQRLISRQLAARPISVCASPEYLTHHGTPLTIEDLRDHQCLMGTGSTWHFVDRGTPRLFTPHGRWRCNSGSAVVDAAASGMGICQLPTFYVQKHVERGELVPILESLRGEPEPIWIVYPQRRHLLPKVRVLADILADRLTAALSSS